MSLRRILVLLVLVAALGAYLVYYELPRAEQEAKKEKLLAVDKEAITAIALAYPDRELEVRKGDGGWRLVKPVDAPADENAVKGVLNTLADAEVQRTLDEMPSDLAPFGLTAPTVTARVTLKDGSQPPAVAVGKNTAIGGKTYVRKGDEQKVYLTASSIGFGLNKQVKDLRDKTLLAFQDDQVTKVAITPAGGETTTLVRKDRDAWTVDPGSHPADATEVRSYLSSLRATRAADFPDDAPADLGKYGLSAPRLVVAVDTKRDGTEATQKLLLGGETSEGSQKQIYAKRDDQPTIYAIGDWSYRSLAKATPQFRDKTVLGFDPGRVGKILVTRRTGEGATIVRGEGGAWTVEGAEGKPPKSDAISRFLDDLRDLRGTDISAEPPGDLGRFGLDAPDLRITLSDQAGAALGSVLATRHEGKYQAMRADGGTVFEVRDYMFTRLDKQRGDFLAAEPGSATTLPAPAAPPDGVEHEDEEDLELPEEE